jgi:SAM-dependent methyltransferase
VVNPEILYQEDYSYVSGTSSVFVEHLREYARSSIRRFGLSSGDLVIDIGSNDGTALRFFQKEGCRVVGVDPAENIARVATANGIETIPTFFETKIAMEIEEQFGPAKLITSHNACAHIDDLDEVLRGVQHLLADDGHFVFEVGYFLDVFQNVWFDTVYHEHLDYHTVKPLIPFFTKFDMRLLSVERIKPQGGSIRVTAGKISELTDQDHSVEQLVMTEDDLGVGDAGTLKGFQLHIDRVRDDLVTLVRKLRSEGQSIVGYGAPTKATTLLTHFQLGDGILDFIVDDNPLKQNLFSPGHHIPVRKADEIYASNPDYVLILAWNFAEAIMEKHDLYREQGGRFIVPMPSLRIVD